MSIHTQTLLEPFQKSTRIIEIGPSFNPVAPKADGWNSAVLDHSTREGLAEKYSALPDIDIRRIEDVDFVWTHGKLSDAVPAEQHGTFDVVIASHVIEHTPDFITFFDAADVLLKPSGTVILVVPDKRFCFDFFQPITTTGQVLEAHLKGFSRHTGQRAFDHFAYAVTDGGAESWGDRPSLGTRLIHALDKARDNYRLFEESQSYHDIHAWHFIPPSFELLLLELAWLGETDWGVERISPTSGWEFFVWLKRGARERVTSMTAEALDAERMILLKRVLLEQQMPIDLLLANKAEHSTERARADTRGSSVLTQTEAALADVRGVLARVEADNSALQVRAAAAEAAHANALHHLTTIEASTFWRATAPLRGALQRVRQLRGARNGTARP